MAITISEAPQGTSEWLEARRGIVTASIVGRLITPTLKIADNETSRALMMTLLAERITGYVEPSYTTPDMERGNECEPIARDLYAELYADGQTVTETGLMVRDDWGYRIGYSADGLVGDDGLLEIKSPRAKAHMRTLLDDNVPAMYMAQVQTGLLVTGRSWIDFCSFHGGLPLYVKRVEPDPEWFAAIKLAVFTFESRMADLYADYLKASLDRPATRHIETEEDIF